MSVKLVRLAEKVLSLKRRFFAASVATALAVTSCGAFLGVTVPASPTSPAESLATGGAPQAGTLQLRVYLMRGDELGVSGRVVPVTLAVARAALTMLLAGPTRVDRAAGLSTAIPAATRLLSVSIATGTATVDLSANFADGAGPRSVKARAAQVVYTLTQFPTVSKVLLRVEGRPVQAVGALGNMARPLSRSNFEQVTPAIFVEVPTPGQSVPSPMHLVGSANVFEAVFRAILKTPTGRVLASAQVHASSGSGTRGVFDVRVSFTKTCGVGVLIVFNVSPKDGSHQNLVRIPVALSSSCERGPVVMAGRSALNAVQPTQRLARASFPGVISVGFP